ncbi:hypothetical protein VNI00_013563 [Paramarasmius palmivorus]|uniref:Uncharacterized protein n=1 Tax=Paramarasmius palmivorus TaxID=297713 RepID=A0AAW0BW35_9AGAR
MYMSTESDSEPLDERSRVQLERFLDNIDFKTGVFNDNLKNHWAYGLHERFWDRKDILFGEREWDDCGLPLLSTRSVEENRIGTGTVDQPLKLWYYDELERRIEYIRTRKFGQNGVVILGSPGVGKSRFLDFLYIRKLCAAEPVIYYIQSHRDSDSLTSNPNIIVIHWNGRCWVTSLDRSDDVFQNELFESVTLLMDSDERPPSHSLLWYLFPVQVTSPTNSESFRSWADRRRTVKIAIEPPLGEDLHRIILRHPDLADCVLQDVNAAIAKWGGNIRTIRRVLLEGDETQERILSDTLRSLPDDQFYPLCRNISHLPLCHTLGIINTRIKQDHGSVAYNNREDMSDYLEEFITSQRIYRAFLREVIIISSKPNGKKLHPEEFCRLLRNCDSVEGNRSVTFESFAHWMIVNDVDGELEMHRLVVDDIGNLVESGLSTKPNFSGTCVLDPDLSIYSAQASTTETRIPAVYYIPEEADNPTFDSFTISPESHGTAFQMTLGRDCSLKENALRLLMARLGPPLNGRKHDFVFVVPRGSRLKAPVLTQAWKESFDFYMMELDCREITREGLVNYTDMDRPCDGNPDLPPDSQDIEVHE